MQELAIVFSTAQMRLQRRIRSCRTTQCPTALAVALEFYTALTVKWKIVMQAAVNSARHRLRLPGVHGMRETAAATNSLKSLNFEFEGNAVDMGRAWGDSGFWLLSSSISRSRPEVSRFREKTRCSPFLAQDFRMFHADYEKMKFVIFKGKIWVSSYKHSGITWRWSIFPFKWIESLYIGCYKVVMKALPQVQSFQAASWDDEKYHLSHQKQQIHVLGGSSYDLDTWLISTVKSPK